MPGVAAKPKELFLSHSTYDRSFVTRLTQVLKQHRIRYWYSATHIRGAKQWHDEIGKALGRCDWFVVVLTPRAVGSKWVKRELLYALNSDRYNERIVPLLRKPCRHSQLSWTLDEYQFVDFTSDFDAGCTQLLRIWRISHQSGKKRSRKRRP